MDVPGYRRIDPEQAWLAAITAITAVLTGGSLLFPRLVWDRFLWQYFWGPVYADANSAVCAVIDGGSPTLLSSQDACATAGPIVAYPGYTLVSEAGYAVTLLFMLLGVIYLLRRLELGDSPALFFALFPFMLFGGALRVVEDANDAVPTGVEPILTYPWNTLIISPVIYFTVFFLTLGALLLSVWLARRGVVDGYERPLFASGVILLTGTIGYLLFLALTTSYVGFFPQIAIVVLIGATAITGLLWVGIERYRPGLNAGTGRMGLLIIWGHMIDGVANVVGIDWGAELGLPYGDLYPKHPANRFLISVGERFPETVQNLIGTGWPFLLVKIIAVLIVLSIFDDRIFEDSPRYSVLLLIAIVAVGLGPGTRDMLRATFGI
ncbi:MAG: DUF63 family protein [Halobacteriales archaeon]|nr:DUF63 family protein [Halobacteriales archaeon]